MNACEADVKEERKLRRVDAHHHLWKYDAAEFGWLTGELATLRRDFTSADLLHEMDAAGVSAAIAVQARESLEETDFLLHMASLYSQIAGVVGWLPIASKGFPALLETYAAQGGLRGLRHVVQAEAAGFLDEPGFNRGIADMRKHGLVYDILILEHQLPEAIRFVDRHPEQMFVVDHLAKPRIAEGLLQPWEVWMRDLARRPNVSCKLSGLVTEAAAAWTPAELELYLNVALEAFHPSRLMAGSDWPVLTPRCSYSAWWQLLDRWAQPLSEDERQDIFCGTATRVYQLF